jgi:predicted dithiol-disulfide oxidoreductase (DUF899 family)
LSRAVVETGGGVRLEYDTAVSTLTRRTKAVSYQYPKARSREDWLAARKKLIRQRDALNVERRRLPMVGVDKEYRLEGPSGAASLLTVEERARR